MDTPDVVGRPELVEMLDRFAPRRHSALRDPGIQASGANVPWLFLLEVGAVGMLLAWLRRKLRIAR